MINTIFNGTLLIESESLKDNLIKAEFQPFNFVSIPIMNLIEDDNSDSDDELNIQNSDDEFNIQNSDDEFNIQNSDDEFNIQNSDDEFNIHNSDDEFNIQNSDDDSDDNLKSEDSDDELNLSTSVNSNKSVTSEDINIFFSNMLKKKGKNIKREYNIDLYDCLDNYFREEIVENSKKNISIWHAPKILIIHFIKYFSDKTINLNYPIDSLDISKYINRNNLNEKLYEYELFAINIWESFGSNYSGHYYSYCKADDNFWYEYNDTRVTKIDINEKKENIYMLFYKLKS